MKHRFITLPVLVLTATYGALTSPPVSPPNSGSVAEPVHLANWEVRITNLTRGQIFSPAVVAVHTAQQPSLWTLGEPASAELTMVAEDAQTGALMASLQGSPFVSDVQLVTLGNGPIPPGQTATAIVTGFNGRSNRLSLVGMLVSTNDAFYGVDSLELPRHGQTSMTGPAYDAGTEANTEQCAHIPGPPCGNGGVRVTQGAEGHVHVHAGIHGGGGLDPAQFDWRNPAVRIEVRRL
ncbi:MAG: spondin domain-containing protein [Planctomycetes bacterium]|nr:spondin domain-containing protein [Planctomycetota bacterium]